MKKVIPLAFILIGLSVSIEAQTPPVDDADAYAVYNAIFAKDPQEKVDKARRLVIQAETNDHDFPGGKDECLKPSPNEEATLRPLINAYKEANKNAQALQRRFDLPNEYQLVSRESIDALFKDDNLGRGWKDFYAKYPQSGGFIQLSAVGFNADKTLALVYKGH